MSERLFQVGRPPHRQLPDGPPPPRFDYAAGLGSGGCCDIDMIWERHGYFLVIENKRPRERIPRGQEIALERLAALPGWTVWIVRGNPPDQIESAGRVGYPQIPMGLADLRAAIQRWWDHV
jgi:hypothetical protein